MNHVNPYSPIFYQTDPVSLQILLQRSKALATVLLARTESYPGTTALSSSSSQRLNHLSSSSRQISTSSSRLNSSSKLNNIQPPFSRASLRRVVSSPDKPCTAVPKPRTAKKPCTAKMGSGKSYSDKPVLLYGEEVKRMAPLKR